jgi:hypothetical protein
MLDILAILLHWFVTKPIDVMFAFGGIAFGTSGLKGIMNPKTRVDRWSSGPTAIILTCYLVAYWHLGTYVSLATGAWGVYNWWFLFFRRYVGMPERVPRHSTPPGAIACTVGNELPHPWTCAVCRRTWCFHHFEGDAALCARCRYGLGNL